MTEFDLKPIVKGGVNLLIQMAIVEEDKEKRNELLKQAIEGLDYL